MFKKLLLIALIVMLSPAIIPAAGQEKAFAEVPARLETPPTPGGDANSAIIWMHPTDAALSTLITIDQDSGIIVYTLSGEEIQTIKRKDLKNLDLRYNFSLNDQPTTLLVTGDSGNSDVFIYAINNETRQLEDVAARTFKVGIKGMGGTCMYRSAATGKYYFFANSEDGDVEQYELFATPDNKVDAKLVREFSVGSETEGCTADDDLGNLYISEEEVALWRYGAEPESGTRRRIVESVGPNIKEQVEGVTILYGEGDTGYLIASNETGNTFLVYTRTDNRLIGEFALIGDPSAATDAVQEPNGIYALGVPLNETFNGAFITSDDQNTEPAARSNFKVASWAEIAAGLNLPELKPRDPRTVIAANSVRVTAAVETLPVEGGRDAADDPSIWIHPTDPSLSTIIGSDKQGGIAVYELDGQRLEFLPDGDLNNVDLRYNFPLGGKKVALVAASNRTNNTITLYAVNDETRRLERVSARELTVSMVEIYGLCMYRAADTGKYYVFANSTKTGDVEQWEVFDDGSGKVDGKVVRTFTVGTQTEGCVVDDEFATLYIGEEAVGLWKYSAAPNADATRTQVDATAPRGRLIADVEGVTLYHGANGTGYIIVSSQGSSEFVLYERAGDNKYVGRFQVTEGEGVDAVSGTDGIDVTNFGLNNTFAEGVFVAQDDRNLNPNGNQNYKLVKWADIAAALNLIVDTSFDPRAAGR
ncbi:MAG: phytase [Anaerolineae bacterium]